MAKLASHFRNKKGNECMNSNNKHDASGQMAGYLYQILAALYLLLDSRESDAQICIEKFDDIAFVEQDEPIIMVQTKHQLYRAGNLSDTSVDLWRTIKSWCDSINGSPTHLRDTYFVILTTAVSRENTAAYFLGKHASRNPNKAKRLLIGTASAAGVQANEKFYSAFLKLSPELQDNLIRNIYIYDNFQNINNLKTEIMSYVRYATLPKFEEKVYDSVLGWWIRAIIECLSSQEPVFINRIQLQQVIFDIGSGYKTDSLPIDIDFTYDPSDLELNELISENRIFIEQLKLISLSSERLRRCIREYYNAFRQRSLWVREQLLLANELQDYEATLIDEWNRLFTIMKEDLADYGEELTEQQKTKTGRALFGDIENLNLPIRERVTQPFIMRGSYHDLANRMRVGWHIDFMERLCHLLKG
ncbi:MAG: ABC-three component system protein [Christensenellales bacterium]